MISVIIPVYNTEKYLEQCLDSVISQTYTNVEIICINDGSTDQSGSILSHYETKDNRVKIITQSNQGLSAARNNGLSVATGKWIMFIDSDDWIEADTCQKIIDIVLNKKVDIVMWAYLREYQNTSLPKYQFEEDLYFSENNIKTLHRRMIGLVDKELKYPEHLDSLVTACFKLYRTDIINKFNIRFIDTQTIGTEDALFNLHYCGYISSAYFYKKALYHYRRNNNASLTSINKPQLANQWRTLYALMQEYIDTHNCDNTFHEALENRKIINLIGLGLNLCALDTTHLKKIKLLKDIINNGNIKKNITINFLKNMPFHWKVFFLSTKINTICLVYLQLIIIKQIIQR